MQKAVRDSGKREKIVAAAMECFLEKNTTAPQFLLL